MLTLIEIVKLHLEQVNKISGNRAKSGVVDMSNDLWKKLYCTLQTSQLYNRQCQLLNWQSKWGHQQCQLHNQQCQLGNRQCKLLNRQCQLNPLSGNTNRLKIVIEIRLAIKKIITLNLATKQNKW